MDPTLAAAAPPSRWWTADDVAHLLGIDRVTVYEHVRRGNLPAKRIGRALRFDPADINRWATRESARRMPARRKAG